MTTIPPDDGRGDPLESALRRDAERVAPPIPEGMERRISEAAFRPARPARRPSPLYVWASAAAAAAVLAAVLVVAIRRPKPASDAAADSAAATELARDVKAMPSRIWETVQPGAEVVLREDPVRQETAALASDARSALGFLADNFIPGDPPQVPPRG